MSSRPKSGKFVIISISCLISLSGRHSWRMICLLCVYNVIRCPFIIIVGRAFLSSIHHARVINNRAALKGNLLNFLRDPQLPKYLMANEKLKSANDLFIYGILVAIFWKKFFERIYYESGYSLGRMNTLKSNIRDIGSTEIKWREP